jgi:hypothetical protein
MGIPFSALAPPASSNLSSIGANTVCFEPRFSHQAAVAFGFEQIRHQPDFYSKRYMCSTLFQLSIDIPLVLGY